MGRGGNILYQPLLSGDLVTNAELEFITTSTLTTSKFTGTLLPSKKTAADFTTGELEFTEKAYHSSWLSLKSANADLSKIDINIRPTLSQLANLFKSESKNFFPVQFTTNFDNVIMEVDIPDNQVISSFFLDNKFNLNKSKYKDAIFTVEKMTQQPGYWLLYARQKVLVFVTQDNSKLLGLIYNFRAEKETIPQ